MRAGFIGTGSMGSILIEAFIKSGALKPQEVTAFNRSYDKAKRLADKYPGLKIASTNTELVQESDIVFLCVKPLEYKPVIDEIKSVVKSSQTIVSITSPVQLSQLEHHLSAKVAKVIPSITNYMLSGATLCMYGESMSAHDQEELEDLLRYISTPIRTKETYTRIISDISSCGPAFVAYFLEQFIQAAVEETGIPLDQTIHLASEMLLGTARLLTDGDLTPEALKSRVSVPGGITAEGLRLMEREMNGMFHRLIHVTHAKYDEDVEKVSDLLQY